MNSKIKGCGFHHVAIRVSDWDKSLRFYCEGLGFAPKIQWGEAPKRAAMLDVGDGNYLEIFERETASIFEGEANLLHLCLRADDCAAAVETARAAGATVTTEAFAPKILAEVGANAKIAFISGPDGEIIEFFECAEL